MGVKSLITDIIGIGVDCEEIIRFEKLVNKENVVSKILSNEELKVFHERGAKKKEFLAGRFVAKEAIIKALSNIISVLDMRDISIIEVEGKSPRVLLSRRISRGHYFIIDVSISHCRSIAMAFCVVQSA